MILVLNTVVVVCISVKQFKYLPVSFNNYNGFQYFYQHMLYYLLMIYQFPLQLL